MKKSFYVFQNGEMRRKDNTLYFETEQGRKYIPVEDTKELHIYGEVNFTKKFLEFCAKKEIIVHVYNHHEYYMGSFYPRKHLNSGYMIVKQVEHYLDETKRLELAKRFVTGAIQNMKQVLKYYANRGKKAAPVIEHLDQYLLQVEYAPNLPSLMGIEGNAKEVYYHAFDLILENPSFLFEKRTRRMPQNRLNAMISFGNSKMYNMILSEIYKTHLDPRIGYLHTSNFRKFSLNLDVAEIFKPLIIDRLILSLISKREITEKNFKKELNGVFLSENGQKKFIEKLDEKMKTTIKHRKLGRHVSYRGLLRLELYKLQKHFMEEEPYVPFQAQW